MLLREGERRSAQESLAVLVGLPLTDMWRYGCQKFEFGVQKPHLNKKGEETTWADWGLVVNCLWRIEGPDGFLLSDEHFGEVRQDEHAAPFYDSLEVDPPVVESVDVLPSGELRFQLTHGLRITVEPRPYDPDNVEEWRFMPPDDDPRGHLVLGESGLSWSGV